MEKVMYVLVAAALLTVLVKAQTTNITVTPEDATVSAGDTITIDCVTSRTAIPSLRINGVEADPQTNSRLSSIGSIGQAQFNFSSLEPGDNGTTIQCFDVDVNSEILTVIVLYQPILGDFDNEVSECEGEDVIVTLSADANPPVSADMVAVSGPVTPSVAVSGQTITITFSDVARSAGGDYIVDVTNSEGTNRTGFSLDVYYGPVFNEIDGGEIVRAVGNSVSLDCSIAESNPPATVTYTTTASSSEGVVFNNNIISIASVTEDNAGDYTCTANNSINCQTDATVTYTLSVGNPPDIDVTITAEYNRENEELTVTFDAGSSDDTITRYELYLIYGDVRQLLSNYTSGLEETDISREIDDTNDNIMVELVAFNRYGSSVAGSADVVFLDDSNGGSGATIATTAVILVLVLISMML